jgi:hypothetical protein
MSRLDDTSGNGELGTYTQWAEAFSRKDLDRALADQALLRRSQLKDGNDYCRTTPAGHSRRAYDTIRAERDDLDYREWNSDTGYSGVNRWPTGPGITARGVESPAQKRRRERKELLDDGF